MAALKRSINLTGGDIQQAWQEVRDDASTINWYVFCLRRMNFVTIHRLDYGYVGFY